jgi:selenocysteine lyase/cysteine desulfurase
LIFNKNLYRNLIPDQPGGGTVIYSDPWRVREYAPDIEEQEDGGTPLFLEGIKAALCVRLKEKMGVTKILEREEELLKIIFPRLLNMKNIEVLESGVTKSMGVISFLVKGAHHNLIVTLLNDRFGIQMRGGCSCAGTYGHTLLGIDENHSAELLRSVRAGDLSCKPGWVRLSVHPTMTNGGDQLYHGCNRKDRYSFPGLGERLYLCSS